MNYNTRFNPTAVGPLHIGHLYMALVNATEACNSGGKFIVRIDDSQKYWIHKIGRDEIDRLSCEYRKQLGMFMNIDVWEHQSTMPFYKDIVGDEHEIAKFISEPMWMHDATVEWIPDSGMRMYPYAPSFTFEKVVWDFYEGVNWLIRGEDIVTESSLYDFFVDIIGIPRMRQTYLPRLRADGRRELMDTTITKSYKTYGLQKQIDKFGVDRVLSFLKVSCLKDVYGKFTVDNIKWNPTVVGFEA